MLTIAVPGRPVLHLRHLVLDFNGTLARDGRLLPGVARRLERLAMHLDLLVLTADTCGGAARELAGLPLRLELLGPGDQVRAKAARVAALAPDRAALGNGANDAAMLAAAELGVAVVGEEGGALQAADLVCHGVLSALDLLLEPARLVATLRED